MAGVLILAECFGQARNLLGIGREIANKTAGPLSVVLFRNREGAEQCVSYGADEVILFPVLMEREPIEALVPVISEEAQKVAPDLILLPATNCGKEMAARLAARLDTGLCSNCTSLTFNDDTKMIEMERLAYGGLALQRLTCLTHPVMATIPPRTFEPAAEDPVKQGRIRELQALPSSTVRIIEKKTRKREAKDIAAARVIVCVGRGFEKKEDLDLARKLAETLGGEIAGTRPVTHEMHWLPDNLCIGLSGISVKPELYIGIGVSGQIQQLTGITGTKVITAINTDDNAPIFAAADLGIVGNLYEVVPKLLEELKTVK